MCSSDLLAPASDAFAAAVATFQQAKGLTADGKLGPSTLALLMPPRVSTVGVVTVDALIATAEHEADLQVREVGGMNRGQRVEEYQRAVGLRPGDPWVPILYNVDRIRDGRSFATRRVVAIQHGEVIFNLQASFHTVEPGPDHQIPAPGNLADPETLPDFKERMAPYKHIIGEWYDRPRPIDLRYVDGDPFSREGVPTLGQRVWMRADGTLPDDPVLHTCIATYASDFTLLDTTLLPHGLSWNSKGVQMASLDHAMWFHRPFRADDWLLYDQHPISTGGARGLAGGNIYTSDGTLAISVVQEGLVRVADYP